MHVNKNINQDRKIVNTQEQQLINRQPSNPNIQIPNEFDEQDKQDEQQHNIPNNFPQPHFNENLNRNHNILRNQGAYEKKRTQYLLQSLSVASFIVLFVILQRRMNNWQKQTETITWAYVFLLSTLFRSLFMWMQVYTMYKQGFIKNGWQILYALYHLLCFILFICYNNYAYSLHDFSSSDSYFNILLVFSLALGYLFYYQIAVIIILVVIMVPIICCVACCCPRRGAMPSWTPTPQALLERLTKSQFKQQSHVSMKDCIICQEEYVEGDQLITLDCDERHYFHSGCITQWLHRNGVCPICRMPVSVLGRSLSLRQNQ